MSEETRVAVPEKDGIYQGVPTPDYVGWPLPSSGTPGKLRRRSLLAVKQEIDAGPDDDTTTARFLGSVVHEAILEPDTFEERYLRLPTPDPDKHRTGKGEVSKNPASTGAYKDEVAELREANPGRTMVDAAMYATAIAMRDHVLRHPEAAALLRADGIVEASMVVTDPEFGIRWKLRPDKLVPKVAANLSVKTTRNAREDIFTHDFFKFGYHLKEAMYKMLLPELGLEVRNAWMLAIESEAAREVQLFNIPEVYLDMGQQLAYKYMRRLAEAFDADEWPGLPGGIIDLFPPEYAYARVDEELAS